MANKIELTKEQLDLLLSVYDEKKTYAAAARAVGISSPVATRIIKEHLTAKAEEATIPTEYNGPQPPEYPTLMHLIQAITPTEQWWQDYER